MKNIVRIAVSAALSGPPRRQRHGAVVFKGNRIISAGFNSFEKTHASLIRWFKYGFPHAEMNAALKAGFDSCYNSDLMVIRIMPSGGLGYSRPCSKCIQMVQDLNIRRVWYSGKGGQILTL